MTLDLGSILLGVGHDVWHNGGGKIGAIDRVVDGDGDLEGFTAGQDRTSDTSPHRLDKQIRMMLSGGRRGLTVRLENAWTGFSPGVVESLRLTWAELFDSKSMLTLA